MPVCESLGKGHHLVIYVSLLGLHSGPAVMLDPDQPQERAWMVQEVASEKEAIFQALEANFEAFPAITREMVEQPYCSCRRAGFRFQVRLAWLKHFTAPCRCPPAEALTAKTASSLW